MATWDWTARANSLVFHITLTQGTPSTASGTFGQSTVTCVITAEGPYDYNYGHKFVVKLTDKNDSNASEYLINWDDTNISYDFPISNGVTVLNKTSTRKFVRGNNGYLNVGFSLEWAQYQRGYSGTYTNTWTGSYSAMYSNCSAPTSISSAATIKAPSTTVRISWSGASGGTNNSISKYKVYYRKASSASTYPTAETYTGTAEVTTTYYDFTVPNERGSYYVFKVQSIGSASGYNSGLSSVYCSTKVNSLPTAPTVKIGTATATTRTITSTESITLSASGSTDSDGQTISYQYRIKPSGGDWGSWTAGSTYTFSTSTLTAGSTKAIQFRGNDGLEGGSAASSVSITRNTAPSIVSGTDTTITSNGTYTANGLTNKFSKHAVVKVKTNKTAGTIYIQAKVESRTVSTNSLTGSSPAWSTESDWAAYTSVAVDSTGITQKSCGVYSTAHALAGYSSEKDYRITYRARFNDGIEVTSYTTFSTLFYCAGKPIIKAIYNQHGTSNVSGTITSPLNFYNKIRIVTYYDGYLTETPSASFSRPESAISINKHYNNENSPTETWYDVTFSRIPDAGSSGTINIVTPLGQLQKIITTSSITETLVPTFPNPSNPNFTFGLSNMKMFETASTTSYQVDIAWPFGSGTYTNRAATYNMSTTMANAVMLRLSYSDSWKDCSLSTLGNSAVSSTLKGTITANNLFGWDSDPLTSAMGNYVGVKTLQAQYVFKNLFGQVIFGPQKAITFDFNTSLSLGDNYIKVVAPINNSYYALGENITYNNLTRLFKLQEGASCALWISGLKRYTYEDVTVKVYWKPTGSSEANTLLSTYTFTKTKATCGKGFTDQNNNYYSISDTQQISSALPMLAASSYTFTIHITGSSTGTIVKTITVTAVQRSAPSLTLNSLTFGGTGNGTWTYSATLGNGFLNSSLPTGASITYRLVRLLNGSYTNASSTFTNSSGSIASSLTSGWSNCTILIKAVVTLTPDFSSSANTANNLLVSKTYTYYSNPILIYASTPTVAYREHQVGINAASEDLGNYAVTIKNSTTKQGVGFKGAYSNIGQVLIQDNSTTQVTTVRIEGFTIDCGTL